VLGASRLEGSLVDNIIGTVCVGFTITDVHSVLAKVHFLFAHTSDLMAGKGSELKKKSQSSQQ
jgi:hypothetical protein